MQTIHTYHIHLSGIVQGIGFRPYAVQLAKEFGLNGCISNSADGVHIECNATEEIAEKFYTHLVNHPPTLANIIQHSINKIQQKEFYKFQIADSINNATPNVLLTPDYAMCQHCKAELQDATNKRFQYPFITCTQCGPRYSIATQLPYDRENTTMQKFAMCKSCQIEYNDVSDRRFYSQTNSCPDCGIQLQLFSALGKKESLNNTEILDAIQQYLSEGKILAVKGIGGYVLLCDATNAYSIQFLRQRKNRPTKPLAILFKDIEELTSFAFINDIEQKSLSSIVAPIVLLKSKPNTPLALNEIAPALNCIGAMLPNSPLLHLIANTFNKPLICTSANISNSPIIFNDEDALQHLNNIADYIVTHNREIVIPQDDSVLQFTPLFKRQIIIRRSRGLAPTYLSYIQKYRYTMLATGALMKSSFTLQTNDKTYVSQYLGSTYTIEAQQSYLNTLAHLQNLLQTQPQLIVADKHPDYFSSQLANELSEINTIPLVQVQHHKAHFAAVLAENNLLQNNEAVLGVIWDGAGLGDDAQIWGSEFIKYENNAMIRCYYFDYFPLFLNDKMAKEPRLSALSICNDVLGSDALLKHKFTDTEWALYKKILQSNSVINCCSMGRIFDAVAALLNLSNKQNYEGEAAMYLQTVAESYTVNNGYEMQESYFMNGAHLYRIPTTTLFNGIVRDILKKKDTAFIAAKFHFSLVHIIEIVANNIGIKNIAFSGGVFQNSLLTDMLQQQLNEKFKLFFHQQLSPNDENISFGQMVFYDQNIDNIQQQNFNSTNKKTKNICV